MVNLYTAIYDKSILFLREAILNKKEKKNEVKGGMSTFAGYLMSKAFPVEEQ